MLDSVGDLWYNVCCGVPSGILLYRYTRKEGKYCQEKKVGSKSGACAYIYIEISKESLDFRSRSNKKLNNDRSIAAGDVRVIHHLATSPDLGDHVDFLDFCEWCKRVKRFNYVKAYLVNGRVSEAAKAMSARLGHRVSTHSVLEVLSWLVKNFPW